MALKTKYTDSYGHYPPKSVQFLLTKVFQKIGLSYLLDDINWFEPIVFNLEDNIGEIRVTYAHNYIFLIWETPYDEENNPKKDWYVLNEMNNPLSQPSILLHDNHEDEYLILWSKENYRALTIEDMCIWFENFIGIATYTYHEILLHAYKDIQADSSTKTPYTKYHAMLESN